MDKYFSRLKSTEFISLDGDVVRGPQLPEKRAGHCMTEIHDGKNRVY